MEERRWIKIWVPPNGYGLQQWPIDELVGAVIPILADAEVEQLSAGTWLGPRIDEQGYVARTCELVVSLQAAGQDRAAWFWQTAIDARQSEYVRFERSVCDLVQGPRLD